MSVITVSCSPKVPQLSAVFSEAHSGDLNIADSSISVKAKKGETSQFKSYDNDYMDGNNYDAHFNSFSYPSMNTFRTAYPTHTSTASMSSSNEFYRTPLADRTHYERQTFNISRSSEQSYGNPMHSTELKNVLPQNSIEKTIRIYAHNPYEPILLHDKDEDYLNTSDHISDRGTSTSAYADTACYPSSSLQGLNSQQTPQKAGMENSNHSIQYVNGRPVVVGASSATVAPSTGSSPSSLLATTPGVHSNAHDLSFDGTQSAGGELFEYCHNEEDMVALVEDLSAPTNERFQQPQIRIHTPVASMKPNMPGGYATTSKTAPHRRNIAESLHTEGSNNRQMGRGARFTATPSQGAPNTGYPSRHPIHALSRNHRNTSLNHGTRAGCINKSSPINEGQVEKSESIESLQKAVDFESSKDTTTDIVVRVSYRERTSLYRSDIPLEVNDYCVVQGDRGYDLGRVIDVQSAVTMPARRESTKATKEDQMERVLRKATEAEIQTLLTTQRADEERALECIREEVRRLNLSMNIKFCEYQFDRQKLCFYFESKEKIMFVPLLKFLHREYQCRIWLQQINRGENTQNSDL